MTAAIASRGARPVAVVGVCAVLAALSLLIPASIAFDPWAWLVWGREVTHLALDTDGGPSWKPLPVAITAVLAPLGGLAPAGWVALTRLAGLLSIVLVARLADRFAGRVAAALAAVAFVLTPDGGPRFLRLLLEGHSALLEAALAVWAVDRHLDGRHGHALVALTGLALLRPEAWPFLGIYGLWLWRHEPTPALRRGVAAAFLLVPLLWFGGDWWGSGDPWHGASSAQVAASDSTLDRFGDAVERVAKVVVVPVWVGVGLALARRDRTRWAVAGLALAWSGLVVVMATVLGYAALSRFLTPAAALLCALGGAGLVEGYRRLPVGATRGVVVAVAVLVSLPLVGPRVLGVADQLDDVADRAALEDRLVDAIDDAGGAATARPCDQVVADRDDLPQPVVAWELDVALADVARRATGGSEYVVGRAGGREGRRIAGDPGLEVRGDTGAWVVATAGC